MGDVNYYIVSEIVVLIWLQNRYLREVLRIGLPAGTGNFQVAKEIGHRIDRAPPA